MTPRGEGVRRSALHRSVLPPVRRVARVIVRPWRNRPLTPPASYRRVLAEAARDVAGPIVVLSPHLDDAALSCWSLIDAPGPVHVINVFAGIPQSGQGGVWDRKLGISDSAAHMRDRLEDDRAALARAGRAATNLPLLDDQYGGALADVPAMLAPHLAPASAVYAPAAIGAHPDHVRVRDAAIALRPDVRLYADLPYALRWGWALPPELAQRWEPVAIRLGEAQRKRKATALRAYGPQLQALATVLPAVDSRRARYEVFWRPVGR
jgi:LmbE family N-acetylglucosaminyl deacetylase